MSQKTDDDRAVRTVLPEREQRSRLGARKTVALALFADAIILFSRFCPAPAQEVVVWGRKSRI
jgi:hypothetical protein